MQIGSMSSVDADAGDTRAGRKINDIIPLYFRIYMVLEQELRGGVYQQGVSLPSEQDLARRFDVSRVTIRNTMALLEEADLVIRQRGRGTFASPTALEGAQNPSFGGLVENIREFERNTSVDILSYGPGQLPNWPTGEGTDAGVGAPALEIVRTRSAKGRPFSHSICYVPYPEADVIDRATLGSSTVLATLEKAGVGVLRADQRLTAVTADHVTAQPLQVEFGAPLILMRRVVYGTDNRIIEMIQICYRPDQFEYRVSLSREAGADSPPRWVPTSE